MSSASTHIEDIPLPDASVDVVISNCVINLAADKRRGLAEAARVLRPGGRFAVPDVIADPDIDAATRADMAAYTGCIAGALTRDEFAAALAGAGLIAAEAPQAAHARGRCGAAREVAQGSGQKPGAGPARMQRAARRARCDDVAMAPSARTGRSATNAATGANSGWHRRRRRYGERATRGAR